MLLTENPAQFVGTLSTILTSVKSTKITFDSLNTNEESKINEQLSTEGERVLLKGTIFNFIGNLCLETTLRQIIAANEGGLLGLIVDVFENDVLKRPFDWVDSSAKALHVLVNASLEPSAQAFLSSRNVVQQIQTIFERIKIGSKDSDEVELALRSQQLVSKLVKYPEGLDKIIGSKEIILRQLLNYAGNSSEELVKSALIVLHNCCRAPQFRETCLDTHKFTLSNFDSFVSASKKRFYTMFEEKRWDEYANVCLSINGFVAIFPEKSTEYGEIIKTLIQVMSEKTGHERKNSATLLAKLSLNEDNKKIMTANHGTEVLVSLKN